MSEVKRTSADLRGKVAIVTGAGSQSEGIGNGRAASVLLAEGGCKLVLVDLNANFVARTKEMVDAEYTESIVVIADVSLQDDCHRIVDEGFKAFGRIDILVNNCGINGPLGNAIDVELEAWTRAMTVNVASMMLMAKYAIPAMLKNSPPGGAIVNIASVAGLKGGNPTLLYPTSKGAVVNMTRAMAVHHAPYIRVNCVCPGMLFTPMIFAGGITEDVREARRNRSVLKTEGNGWDCGAAVVFLASGNARWITGAILPVDAGATAAIGIDMPYHLSK